MYRQLERGMSGFPIRRGNKQIKYVYGTKDGRRAGQEQNGVEWVEREKHPGGPEDVGALVDGNDRGIRAPAREGGTLVVLN